MGGTLSDGQASVDVVCPSHRVRASPSRQAGRPTRQSSKRQSASDPPQDNGPWFGPDEAANLEVVMPALINDALMSRYTSAICH